jgi:hypothetical protein
MPTKTHAKTDDVIRRQRLDRFAKDAERARREYAEVKKVVDERTALLRRQRLQREAVEAAPLNGTKRKAAKLAVTRRARAEQPADRDHVATGSYRFRPGQRVRITLGQHGRAPANGSYRVVGRLPADDTGSNLYRIRSDREQHDRVVAEAHLSPISQ